MTDWNALLKRMYIRRPGTYQMSYMSRTTGTMVADWKGFTHPDIYHLLKFDGYPNSLHVARSKQAPWREFYC